MAKCTFQEGAGSPVGVAVPKFIGQLYHDTTNDEYWRSTGLTNADWVFVGLGVPFVEWLPHTEIATWNDSGGIGQNGDYTAFLAASDLATISYLNLNGTAITSLVCNNCPELTSINCDACSGPLTVLDVLGCSSLSVLSCANNAILNLDLSSNHGLSILRCGYNSITSLDLSNNTALSVCSCLYNSLTTLDLSFCPNLTTLDCISCSLTSLTVIGCNLLSSLYCMSNSLTTFSVSGLTFLSQLIAYSNNLTTGAGGAVNVILTDMVLNAGPVGSIDLSNQTPLSPPDAGPPDGATAKTTLIGLGWLVSTD